MEITSLPIPLMRMLKLRSEIEALSAMATTAGRRDLAASCDGAAAGINQWLSDLTYGETTFGEVR
jgi:hypothetical protein